MLPADEIRLFIVIPVHGNWGDTVDCLRNLAAQSSMAFRVLLADDGSDEAAPPVIGEFEFVRYARFQHRGFAGNCNAGAAEAIRLGATHLLFLNSDTAFSTELTAAWLRVISERPDSIISPLIFFFSDPSQIWFSGGRLSILTPFFRTRDDYATMTPVDFVSGCALLVPVSDWKRLGGFDERYVTYFEDLDFTLRARYAGIEVCIVPDAPLRVLHKVAGSFGGSKSWPREYRLLTSSLVFIRVHYRGVRKLTCLVLSGARLAMILLGSLPRLPDARRLWNSVVRGLAD